MKLSRRLVLRGLAGATLALPFLESVGGSSKAVASEGSTPPFFIAMRQANGVATGRNSSEQERFWPNTSLGTDLNQASLEGRALEELVDFRQRLLVLGNVNLESYAEYADGHANGAVQALTARGPAAGTSAGGSQGDGISLDTLIGQELNENGNESLYLYAGRNNGWLGGACASWRGSGAGNKRSPINDPWTAYLTMVGGATGNEELHEALAARRQSINDLVRQQTETLMSHPRISQTDRQKLQQHLASIRDLEVALSCHFDASAEAILENESAVHASTDGNEVLATSRLHLRIGALAIACGYTRSVLLQIGNGNDGDTRYWHNDGTLMENFHYVSHRVASHGADGDPIDDADVKHHEVDRQFARTFRYLLEQLDQYTTVDGTPLLDAGIALWYNDLGNGPPHSHAHVPYIIAGSAGGQLVQGRHVELSGAQWARNHDRLLNTIGAAVGLTNASGDPLDDFGDAGTRGRLSEILA